MNETINNPLVSIILPTYNRLDYLKIAIDSVIQQTYSNWELFVIDDISDDGTKEYMSEIQVKDNRINYIKLKKDNIPGISKFLNYGIKISKGKYIARLDDDDSWCYKNKLEEQVRFLEENNDYVMVGGGIVLVDENLKPMFKYYKKETDDNIRKFALLSNPFTHTTVLFRKVVAEKMGGYDNLPYAEDWDFWLRLGTEGKLYNIHEYFTNYMCAGQNKSFLHQRRQAKAILGIIKNYKNKYPNYNKAYFLNLMQYVYSFLPLFVRKQTQSILYYIKRKHF